MDLYLNLALIFIFGTAFSLYLYSLTKTGDTVDMYLEFSQEDAAHAVEQYYSKDLTPFLNNPSISGTDVYALIKRSRELDIAVLVQTKDLRNQIVNYGYQLRDNGADYNIMQPRVVRDIVGEFDQAYLAAASSVFTDKYENPYKTNLTESEHGVNMGDSSYLTNGEYNTRKALDNLIDRTSNSMPSDYVDNTPKLYVVSPLLTPKEAFDKGKGSYYTSGVLYTTNVRSNSTFNDKANELLYPHGKYYLNQSSKFYSTLIVNTTGDILGVYVEEHGVNLSSNILGTLMMDSRLIRRLY